MVVTILEPPYVMLKCPECSGNERYEGFAIDLLEYISKVREEKSVSQWKESVQEKGSQFEYKIYTVPDKVYGVYDHHTGQWNGIVRELIDRKADIAVAPMTINYAR